MWLLKSPQPVTRALSSSPGYPSCPVAKVTISVDPLQSNDNSSATEFTMELTGSDSENALSTYSLNMSTDFYPMSVFSESTQGKVTVEGKIVKKFSMQPQNVARYGKPYRERNHKRETERRKIKVIDYVPEEEHRSPMPLPRMDEEKKKVGRIRRSRRARKESGDLENIIFRLFETQPYWTFKQLLQHTNQPEVRGAKGPVFEDGPNFELAFTLFHGRDGVVPLSAGRCMHPQFNPLAAKAATISLTSSFGPFSFDSWKNQNKKSHESSNKDSSSLQGGNSHEAVGNQWLQMGNCPIAKSYRAVCNAIPLVAKALQLPPGMKYRCPPAVVAARAALANTAFAKNLRPQPLPAKVLAIGLLGMAANLPLGIWREHTEKFSPSWFAAVHAAVPFLAILRKSILMPKSAMAFTIAASVLGQVIGSRAERFRRVAIASKKPTLHDSLGHIERGRCGDIKSWNPVATLQVSIEQPTGRMQHPRVAQGLHVATSSGFWLQLIR